MSSSLHPPLQPPNGQVLKVLGIGRVSKADKDKPKSPVALGKHDELSLEDQEALLKNWLQRNYGKPFHLDVISSTGSGEFLDRAESAQALAAVESRKYHVVLAEDLGRIFRRVHAFFFCECCEDNDVRLIALNDFGVDTGRDDWRMAAFFAVMRHESYNRDTAARIRRTLRNRFVQGGIFQVPIYGYVKPPGVKSDDEVAKDPAAEPIYDEWFRRLEDGAFYSEVADWLNNRGVAVGPYCRDQKWSGRMVRRLTFNPILKGLRVRNNKMSKRINKTGRRKLVDAPPEERLERTCPHLAFIEPARYDRLIRRLRARDSKYTRGRKTGVDNRKGVSRKRTAWPGQAVICGVCGRVYYWGGHGQTEHLMCSGSRDWKCWNGVTFDGVEGAKRLCKAIMERIEDLNDFDAIFMKMVRQELATAVDGHEQRLAQLLSEREVARKNIQRATDRLVEAEGTRRVEALTQKLDEILALVDQINEQIEQLQQAPRQVVSFPSMGEIKEQAREMMGQLAVNSPEFGRRIRSLVPSITVYPYRLVDGGKIVLRAKLVLNLAPLVESQLGPEVMAKYQDQFRHVLVVDLFDPPQRVVYRDQVMALRAKGLSEKRAAAQLGITATAAQRAAVLQRLMDERGLTDPYVLVKEPPADCSKLRRHLNPRYSFELLEGYPDW